MIVAFLVLAHFLIVAAFTIRILLRDDLVPTTRLAWFIVLMLLPYAGTLVYFLFGEVNLGKSADARHTRIFDQIRKKAADAIGTGTVTDNTIALPYRPAFHYAASINGFQTVTGNTAEVMRDAAHTRARMIADIDGARDHVHVLYYIWLNDDTGTELGKALIRAAQRGVTCRAIADGMGSRAMIHSPLWREMKKAGVHLAIALPFRNVFHTMITSRLDLRNHRKITVIDGAIGYCGSQNCADPEFRVKPKYAPWVDIMLRFQGPVVAQNQLLFASDWMQATDASFDIFTWGKTAHPDGFAAVVMGDGPTERMGATPQLFATLINCARDHITLTTPYFVPDATVFEALCSAAYRGVRVTLIFPEKNDSWIVAAASRSYYKKLLTAGARIHEFKGGLLHAKTLTVDDTISLIGSSNLDLRSFDLNYENNILLQDSAITADIMTRQTHYLSQSDEVRLSHVLNWPYHNRIWNNVIATIGPIL